MVEQERSPCPCGSGRAYGQCCGPLHGGTPAASAEALMRSRYSAYVQRNGDYLLATWHPTTRPASMAMNQAPEWLGLTVVSSGGEGEEARVEFEARFRQGSRVESLHETSRFVREAGRWFYVDGVLARTPTTKVGRNDPCPCGSGRKFKQCCAR